jgi:hypothetical protein
MEVITTFLTQIIYHALEIVELIGNIAGELSNIHFPPAV